MEIGGLFVVESAAGCEHNAARVVGHSPKMPPSQSLPRQLIGSLFNGQQHDTLPPKLGEHLKKRPQPPFRGATAHLISLFLTRPYAALLLLKHVVPLFGRLTEFGSTVFYDKHRDVRDIMDRDDDFPSGPTIGPGLVSGDFILGMDRCPLHREDLAMLWEALYHIKPPKGEPLTKTGPGPHSPEVDKQLENAGWFRKLKDVVVKPIDDKVKRAINHAIGKRGGEIDLVQEVFRPACVEIVVQRYFGIGPVDKKWAESLWDILQIVGTGIALPYHLSLTNKSDPVIRDINWAAKALEIAVFEAVAKTRARYEKTITKPKKADEQAIAQANATLTAAIAAAASAGENVRAAVTAAQDDTIVVTEEAYTVIVGTTALQNDRIAIIEEAQTVMCLRTAARDETIAIAQAAQDAAVDDIKATYTHAVALSKAAQANQEKRMDDFLDQSDLIGRMYAVLVQKRVSEDDIPAAILRNVVGLAIAGCPPVAKAAAQAVDVLLHRPLALKGASHAARKAVDPNATKAEREANRALFWEFIFEALRFFPPFPLLTRACLRDTSIATSQGRRRKVRAGQTVVLGMLPALFDEEAVPFPGQFRTDRALGDSLVFGRGLHACLGFQLAREVLVAMLLPLFAHPHGFDRIPGREGKLKFDFLAVKSLNVQFKLAEDPP